MLGLSCLIKNTRAVELYKNAISVLVANRLENGKNALFPYIYKELRDNGAEIDAESAGALYNELYGSYNDASLSIQEEIEEFAGKDIQALQDSIIGSLENKTSKLPEQQIGDLPPEKQVSQMIGKMFKDSIKSGDIRQASIMKQMEELVSKAARELLPKREKISGKTVLNNLDHFFEVERESFRTLSGSLNTLQQLHSEVKSQTEQYANQVASKMSDEDAEIFKQQWAAYTESFIKSSYGILLGKSDQSKLLNQALSQIDINGIEVSDINGNIKWSNLKKHNNSDNVMSAIRQLMKDGIQDKDGVVHKYTGEQATRIGEFLQGVYDSKLAAFKEEDVANKKASKISAKNIISEFIKDIGFISLAKDKNGELLMTPTNWDAALDFMKRKVGEKTGSEIIYEKLDQFLTEKGFDDNKKEKIIKAFRGAVTEKMLPGTARSGAMQKFIALKNLNAGKAFDNETSSALNNLLGVSDLDQKVIDQLRDLAEATDNIMKGQNVTGSVSNDAFKNRGAYAYQALSQIERRIKEIVRENNISKSKMQWVVKNMADYLSAASTSLLLNPGNFGENILTGFATNVSESISLLLTNKKLFSKVGQAQKDFWTAFASHVSGGVANEIVNEAELSSDIQAGERLRVSAFWKEFKKNPLGAVLKFPAYGYSVVSRTIMNSFDVGFNSAILRKKAISSIYNSLKAQGFTGNEVLKMMDDALNVDSSINEELDKQNEEIKKILNKSGIYPSAADMAQNKKDLKFALYEKAILQGATSQGLSISDKQVLEINKSIIESASMQAKVVGGKKQMPITGLDILNTIVYGTAAGALAPQRILYKQQTKREKQGKLTSAALNQAGAELWKNTIARFAGGIANFLALATTATPWGFVTAASIHRQKKSLLKDDPDAADIYKADPEQIRKYAEFHGLVRSMTIRATLGTVAITSFVLSKLADDDDDDDGFISNLMETKSGRRFLQKYLPLGINAAAMILYDNDDPKLDSRMSRVLDFLSNTTGNAYDSWGNLKTSIQRSKDYEDANKAVWGFLGSTAPTMNLNQAEQITKFIDVINSGLTGYTGKVEQNEETARQVYKDIENGLDAFLVNGIIDAIIRATSEDKKFNRYSEN